MVNSDHSLKINWVTSVVLLLYPMFVFSALVAYCWVYDTGWLEWTLAIVTYYIANISVGVGLHRLWSHAAYKTNKFVEFILMLITSGTLQGPVIAWASDHARHHTYMDKEYDPHSPSKYKNKVLGFLWSHVGWMLVGESSYKHIEKGTMKRLGRNKILIFQLHYYWQLAVLTNLILPLIIGYIVGGTLQHAVAGYIFMGVGRALQQQMTFCVNSLCHFAGTQPYLNGTPGDIWWLFFLLLGENWHNFHHAFARDYRNGWKKTQLDVHKWIIYAMSKVGLAWDLVVTPTQRILAKQQEAELQLKEMMLEKALSIETGALSIVDGAKKYVMSLERSAGELTEGLKLRLIKLEKAAEKLLNTVKVAMLNKTLSSQEKIFASASKKLAELERLAASLGLNLATA